MGNKRVIIDYVSATGGMHSELDSDRNAAYDYLDFITKYFKLEKYQVEECKFGTNNFQYQFILAEYIILRFCGPRNELGYKTWQIELKGEGCRQFERLLPDVSWYEFLEFLMSLNLNFKRIDITIDDLAGDEITIADIFEKSKKRQYTSVFRAKPTYHGILEDGLTIDFGSRTSMTELCIYDKKKQQELLGNPVELDYWARYELRFRQGKADAIVLDLLENYENPNIPIYGLNLQEFATKALYATIDFKEDNNYNESYQSKVLTDPKWKAFIGDIDKAKLPAPESKKSTYQSAYNYIMPKAKNLLLTWLIESKYDRNQFLYRVVIELQNLIKDLTIPQQQKINKYLCEMSKDMKPLDNHDFENIRKRLYEIEDDLILPF